MSRKINIANRVVIVICMLLLIVIGVILFKVNDELDFNTITPGITYIETNTIVNELQENVVVDSNIIE